jgi:GTPase
MQCATEVRDQQETDTRLQVNVLDFKERKKGKDYILVELVVERNSQKGIILGRQGAALKALASSARADIEEYLERPVYMDVMVRVDKEWRKSARKLEKFGY